MDSSRVNATCVRLLSSIADLTTVLRPFAHEVSSISLCCESLKEDLGHSTLHLPPTFWKGLDSVLSGSDGLIRQTRNLLDRLSSDSIRQHVQWALIGQSEILRLQFGLEMHKETLDIALNTVSIFLYIIDDGSRKYAEQTQEQTLRLLREISMLRMKLQGSRTQKTPDHQFTALKQFLYQSTALAETIIGHEDSANESESESVMTSSTNPSTHSVFSLAPRSLITQLSFDEPLSPSSLSHEQNQQHGKTEQELGRSASRETSHPASPIVRQSLLSDIQQTYLSQEIVTVDERRNYSGDAAGITSPYIPVAAPEYTRPLAARVMVQQEMRPKPNISRHTATVDTPEKSHTTHASRDFEGRMAQEDVDERRYLIQHARKNREKLDYMKKKRLDASLHALFYSTLTYASSKTESLKAMADLLDKGADVDAVCEGDICPSLRAVVKVWRTVEHTSLFWKYGASVNEFNSHGGGALYEAVECGDIGIVKFLLAREAWAAPDAEAADRMDPILYNSILKGREDIAMLLVQHGIQSPAFSLRVGLLGSALNAAAFTGSLKLIDHFLQEGIGIDFESGPYGTPLLTAVRGRSLSAVERLIEGGADVNWPNTKWGTALHLASLHPPSGEATRIVKYLLRKGASINIRAGAHHTALHAALYVANDAVVALLLHNGADPSIRGRSGRTTLMTAASSKSTRSMKTIQLLLHADIKITDKSELDALCLAAQKAMSDAATEQAKIQLLQECYKSVNGYQETWWERVARNSILRPLRN